ncbi:MAG: hypothetical protein FJY10_07230 [Bacteroidetes bacterium]|nr:hypothetical protein [Bacteroidota bacterium]
MRKSKKVSARLQDELTRRGFILDEERISSADQETYHALIVRINQLREKEKIIHRKMIVIDCLVNMIISD